MRLDSFKKFAALSVSIFLGLAALMGAIYGFGVYIDSRVERHVNTDAFLKRVADAVRPSCIFDQQGAIIVDMGAMVFIDAIDVAPLPKDDLPPTVVVHPKFDWIYKLSYVGIVNADWRHIRYRLEVVY